VGTRECQREANPPRRRERPPVTLWQECGFVGEPTARLDRPPRRHLTLESSYGGLCRHKHPGRRLGGVSLDISSPETRVRFATRTYVGVDVRWRLLAADRLAAAAAATVCRRQSPPHAGDDYVLLG